MIDLRKKKAEVTGSEHVELVQKHHHLGDLGCAASPEGTSEEHDDYCVAAC